MKLKEGVRKFLVVVLIYVVAGVGIFAMSQRVERLNEEERLEKEYNISVKNNK